MPAASKAADKAMALANRPVVGFDVTRTRHLKHGDTTERLSFQLTGFEIALFGGLYVLWNYLKAKAGPPESGLFPGLPNPFGGFFGNAPIDTGHVGFAPGAPGARAPIKVTYGQPSMTTPFLPSILPNPPSPMLAQLAAAYAPEGRAPTYQEYRAARKSL